MSEKKTECFELTTNAVHLHHGPKESNFKTNSFNFSFSFNFSTALGEEKGVVFKT
jgi:hypothetical protein